MIWWANKDPRPPLEPQTIKPILKALLDNTKDKNTVVRAYSDQAIVNLLKMRQGDDLLQVGARPGPGTRCTRLSSVQQSWRPVRSASLLAVRAVETPVPPQVQDRKPGGTPCVPTLCPRPSPQQPCSQTQERHEERFFVLSLIPPKPLCCQIPPRWLSGSAWPLS